MPTELNVPITAGSGTGIDTVNVGTGGVGTGNEALRQVVSLGDATTKANILLVDANGNALIRQGAPVSGATTGTLTASGQSVTCTTAAGYQEAMVTLSGTYGAFQMGIELSDDGGTTWFFAPVVQQVIGLAATVYPNNASNQNVVANSTVMYRVPVFGLGQVRVRSNGGPGTGTCNVRITLVPFGTPMSAVVDVQTLSGTLVATALSSTTIRGLISGADNNPPLLASATYLHNSLTTSSFDMARSMENIAALASAARTATTTVNLTMVQNCAILVVVDVTARASATTLTPSLLLGNTTTTNVANKTIWTAAAAINTASGTTMYAFWPFPTIATPTGLAEVVNLPIFREMQLVMTHSDANSITYRVNVYTAAVG